MSINVCGQCRSIVSKTILVDDERIRVCPQCKKNDKMRERFDRWKRRDRY